MKMIRCYFGVEDGWDSEMEFTVCLSDHYAEVWENGSEAMKMEFLSRWLDENRYFGYRDE